VVKTLSIIIPAHDEDRYIETVLDRVAAIDLTLFGLDKEVIVVDDGSRDRTAGIVAAVPSVRLCRLERRQGKGRAVRAGIEIATGEYVIIQDADLEYDPRDHIPMLKALLENRGDVVYGSRYLDHGRYPNQSLLAYLGGRSLSVVVRAVTGHSVTDAASALKLFHRGDVAALDLESTGFEIDQELTARLLVRGRRIVEVPVRYSPRPRAEGKKIRAKDWFLAIGALWRYRRG
jgi:glycosyltransferase involved in cell wall biosynthesis